jgi:uncharacterized protein
MRVNIDEIKEGGLDRTWDFTPGRLDEILAGDPAGYRARAPARVSAHLERLGERVLLRARTRADLGAPCGRCLAPVAVPLPVEFSLTFVPVEKPRHGGEREPGADRGKLRPAGSFGDANLNEEWYAGREIDLGPVVREQILLALPPYPLCREDCKGLCPVCGQNLNERECGCDRHVPDPRWAGLEKFRSRTKTS